MKKTNMKKNLSEEVSRIKSMIKMVNEGEYSNIQEGRGMDISLTTTIFSHLNDLPYDSGEMQNIRTNFLKVLIEHYLPENIWVNTDVLDQLFEEVKSGNYNGDVLKQNPTNIWDRTKDKNPSWYNPEEDEM
jgi:hypothetical protein